MPALVSHPDEVRVLSRRFGKGATNIDKYIELDGYKAVQQAIAQGPEKMAGWIIDTMKASGLRGRGGAGFPTGMKWSFVPKTSEKPKYVLVNGDESEPGTCKDHIIFLEDPHAVIEGTMIAGLAIGSKLGFIYLRGEYRYLLKIVEKAVADAYAKGFLGKNIFGSGLDFDVITQTGAGAYESVAPADTVSTGGTMPAPGYASQADIATDPRGLTGTGLPATETGTALPATETGNGLAATETGAAEGVPVGKHAAAAADAGAATDAGASAAADAGLRPGEATDRLGDFGDIAFGNLLPDAAQYSAQWQQIQFRFVDDPQASVTEAAEVLSQVTGKLEAAIQERQRAIEERKQAIQERASALRGRWGEGSNADTETLRETLRMYRAFMNQLIGPMS